MLQTRGWGKEIVSLCREIRKEYVKLIKRNRKRTKSLITYERDAADKGMRQGNNEFV